MIGKLLITASLIILTATSFSAADTQQPAVSVGVQRADNDNGEKNFSILQQQIQTVQKNTVTQINQLQQAMQAKMQKTVASLQAEIKQVQSNSQVNLKKLETQLRQTTQTTNMQLQTLQNQIAQVSHSRIVTTDTPAQAGHS